MLAARVDAGVRGGYMGDNIILLLAWVLLVLFIQVVLLGIAAYAVCGAVAIILALSALYWLRHKRASAVKNQ